MDATKEGSSSIKRIAILTSGKIVDLDELSVEDAVYLLSHSVRQTSASLQAQYGDCEVYRHVENPDAKHLLFEKYLAIRPLYWVTEEKGDGYWTNWFLNPEGPPFTGDSSLEIAWRHPTFEEAAIREEYFRTNTERYFLRVSERIDHDPLRQQITKQRQKERMV